MLFQRLYNWIKYKTLPPSFLFKNRLFIERDSKHRRIFSNFGLNFRSSKWSMYDTYNIKLKSKNNYIKYFLITFCVLFAFFLIITYKNYYVKVYLFNNFAFFIWIIIDSFDYYLSFIIWLFVTFISFVFNTIYSYFFFNNFSKKTSLNEAFLLRNKEQYASFSTISTSSSKFDLNWILYSWLTNKKIKNNTFLLEKLFETNVNKHWWNKNYEFFPSLYRSLFIINLIDKNNSIFTLKTKLASTSVVSSNEDFKNLFLFINNNSLINKYADIVLFYILNFNKQSLFEKTAKFSINTLQNWNLNSVLTEEEKYSFLLKSKTGLFFFDNFNYQKLNYLFTNFNEFWVLNFYIKNQVNSAKWNRWLYRYSILHRKLLKNSHKLTIAKRLVNSGLYDNKFFNRNLWNSEYFSRYKNSNAFTNLFNSYYVDLFSIKNENNLITHKVSNGSFDQKKKLALLSFYENSYFWFLKRYYFFNTLPSNALKSKLKINFFNQKNSIFDVTEKNETLEKYFFFASSLLKTDLTDLSNLSISSDDLSIAKNKISNFSDINYFSKDLYLLFNENDIFNKDNLYSLFWITSVMSSKNDNSFLKYLSLNDSNNFSNFASSNFFLNSDFNNYIFNYYLFYSFVPSNSRYLRDLSYLSLFY